MEYRVKDLFQLESFGNAKIVSGEKGINNEIKGITIIEAPDIANWITGGEVLLTSLFALESFTDEQLSEFIKQISDKEVSALVIKTGRFIDEIPAPMISTSEELNLPIIQIPKDTAYADILYPVMENLSNEELTRLKFFKETHDHFIALSLSNQGVERIIFLLEKIIGNPILLCDKNYFGMFSTNRLLRQFTILQQIEHTPAIYTKYPYFKQKVKFELADSATEQLVIPIEVKPNIKMNLIICEIDKQVELLDYIAIENAVTSLSIELVKQFSVMEVEKRFENDLIEDILNGKRLSVSNIYQRANLLGLNLTGPYVAVLFQYDKIPFNADKISIADEFSIQDGYYKLLYETVRESIDNAVIQSRSDRIIALLNIEGDRSTPPQDEIKSKIIKIQEQIKKQNPELTIKAGIGNTAKDIIDISRSFKEANDALHFGQLIDSNSNVFSYTDLGVFRVLCQYDNPLDLEEFIPNTLRNLQSHKQSVRNDLFITLRVYLKNNLSVTKTSQELFVHYKTVIYRIDRIKEITGIDFNNSEEIFSAQLGLKIITLIENSKQNNLLN